MSLNDLEQVHGFKIWNEHGSILWLEDVDLIDVDLAEIVTIVPKNVEVYEDEGKHKDSKPEVGKKLNHQAVITLNNIKPKKNQTSSEKEESLKTQI